jgi:hypothetical protein
MFVNEYQAFKHLFHDFTNDRHVHFTGSSHLLPINQSRNGKSPMNVVGEIYLAEFHVDKVKRTVWTNSSMLEYSNDIWMCP